MAINLDVVILNVIGIVVGSIIISPILWLVGKHFVGAEKAKFFDAFWIIFLGQVIGSITNIVFGQVFVGISASIIGFIIQLIVWLGLVKHFFDTESWGKAFIIALVAVIVSAIIFAVIAAILFGLGMLMGWWPV
jgi:hypothetical protein